jgi:hypothetical protein
VTARQRSVSGLNPTLDVGCPTKTYHRAPLRTLDEVCDEDVASDSVNFLLSHDHAGVLQSQRPVCILASSASPLDEDFASIYHQI